MKPKSIQKLDRLKLNLAQVVLKNHSIEKIRESSLAAMARWRSIGSWCSGYTEWQNIMENSSDEYIRFVMTSEQEEPCNRLRQSPPYVDLITEEQMACLHRELRNP